MTLPTFLIIGAAKAGTTALYHYLLQHPEVFMSPLKETNYFAMTEGVPPSFSGPGSDELNRDSIYRWSDYKALFDNAGDALAIGEASPRYMFTQEAAARIQHRLPEVRLVSILRDPAERAFSHFMMRKRDGTEPEKTLREAVADEPRRLRKGWGAGLYALPGFYAEQLEPYFTLFAREQIRVYRYEDFVNQPGALMGDLYEFIGVDPGFMPDMSVTPNESGIIRNPLLRLLWTHTHRIRRLVRPVISRDMRQQVSGYFTSRPKIRSSLSEEMHAELLSLYEDDILKLEVMLDCDLSSWRMRPEREQSDV